MTTETGKPFPKATLLAEIIEAERAEAVAAERARIRAAVMTMGDFVVGWDTDDGAQTIRGIDRAAVLAIVNPEAKP
jgi:hypothetical protein